MKKLRMILLALFLVIGVSGTGNATTMTELLIDSDSDGYGDGSIQVGDKLFSDWSYELFLDDSQTFDLDLIEVVALDADPLNPGIRFQNVYSEEPAFFVNDLLGSEVLDVEFTFKVSVVPGSPYLIDGVSSAVDGSIEDGLGIVLVGDDISEAGGAWAPWLEWDPSKNTIKLSDSVEFAPVSEIWVTKDINLTSLGGEVEVNWVDQYFHQTPVPEPTTMLLMGVGLLGICGVTRKKRD